MGVIASLGRYAWRFFKSEGLPDTGENEPDKVDIFAFVDQVDEEIERLKQSVPVSEIFFATKAEMDVDLGYAAGVKGIVTNDPTLANNGTYEKLGDVGTGSWAFRIPSIEVLVNAAVSPATGITEAFSADFTMEFRNADGSIFMGLTPEGDWISNTEADANLDPVIWNGEVYIRSGSSDEDETIAPRRVTYGSIIGDSYEIVKTNGGAVEYAMLEANGNFAPLREKASLAPLNPFLSSVSKLAILFVCGQSTGAGLSPGSPSALTTTAIGPGKVAMGKRGVRILGNTQAANWLTYPARSESYDGFVSAYEIRNSDAGETGWAQAAKQWADSLPSDTGVIVFTAAIGSATSAQIAKGSNPYLNVLRTIAAIKTFADAYGLTITECRGVLEDGQSEATSNTSAATWSAFIQQLRADLQADINAITGLSAALKLYVNQTHSHPENTGGFGRTRVKTPQGVLDAAAANANVIPAGAHHYWDLGDGVHYTSAAYRDKGFTLGKVLAAGAYTAMRMSSASRTGTAVTLTFTGVSGSLTQDTTRFVDPGQFGIKFYDSSDVEILMSGAPTIVGNTVQFTLASAPPDTNNTIELGLYGALYTGAGKTTAGHCLRSSTNMGNDPSGNPTYKWAHCGAIACN